MKRLLIYIYKFFLHAFALVGVVLVGGFFAVRFHLTDVSGAVDAHNQDFQQMVLGAATQKANAVTDSTSQTVDALDQQISQLSNRKTLRLTNLCKIDAIGQYAPVNAKNILSSFVLTQSDEIVRKMVFAATLRLRDAGKSTAVDMCDTDTGLAANLDYDELAVKYADASGLNIFVWMNDEEWKTIEDAIIKDKDKINQAAAVAGVEPRLVVASAIVEQIRLFHSQRELFKKFFQPLKILGNSNTISLGIMGVKDKTAVDSENHLKDPSSPYYLGSSMEHALDCTSSDPTSERYDRLTNENDHYYSYLYGAIYMKEMMTQWKNAGYDIAYRPEIVGTLFNVGFAQSKPNADPKVGGSEISVGSAKYSFGSLAYEFYYSGELLDAFPYVVN